MNVSSGFASTGNFVGVYFAVFAKFLQSELFNINLWKWHVYGLRCHPARNRIKQGQILGRTVADGWAGAEMRHGKV